MAETEAVCLLRTGALYPRRIGLRDESGRMVFAGVKRGAFSLYFDDEPIYHFDLDGRWQRAYIEGDHFRKSLDQSVDLIGRKREPEGLTLRRRSRSRMEIIALDDAIRATAIDVSERLGTGKYEILAPPAGADALSVDELHDLLDRVASWNAAAWFARIEDYARVYGADALRTKGPLLPPDAQNAIVIDPFAPDGRSRTPEEFNDHCSEVARFVGRRAIQATTAFLAGADALRRPVGEIVANLETIARWFPFRDDSRPVRPRDLPADRPSLSGVDVLFEFWQDGSPLPDGDGWRELASAKVRRVTASFADARSRADSSGCVEAAKAAGVAVSAVLAYGVSDPAQMADSAEAVNALPLSPGDFVHLVESDEGLAGDEAERQREVLAESLQPTLARGAKVTKYDPAKRWT